MPTDEEIRYYQSLNEAQKRNYTRRLARGLAPSGDPISRDELDVPRERRERPREAPREKPRAAAQPSIGKQVLGAGKNWLENAAANLGGREPPHRAKSKAGRWLENASRNVQHMNANPFGGANPFGNPVAGLGGLGLNVSPPPGMGLNVGLPPGMGPAAPAPRKHGKKKHHRRREPEEEAHPWDPNYLPDGVRRFR